MHICFDAFVDFIMQSDADVSCILSSVRETMKQQHCCNISVMNAGKDMYAQHRMRDHIFKSHDLFSIHVIVYEIEPARAKPLKQGIYSP